ncbi:hypothetical protein A2U01_0073236, partial [Trifolium medium]|nr:hypothetical protein [Trifolium medium]
GGWKRRKSGRSWRDFNVVVKLEILRSTERGEENGSAGGDVALKNVHLFKTHPTAIKMRYTGKFGICVKKSYIGCEMA